MRKVSIPIVMLILIGSFFLLKKEDRTQITEKQFETLLKNNLVEHLVIVTNRKQVEVYLDEEAIAQSDSELGKNLNSVCIIYGIERESFSAKLVKLLEEMDPEDWISYEYEYRGKK